MRKKILLIILAVIFFPFVLLSQNYYLGVGTPGDEINSSCASCHSTDGVASDVYSQWVNTRHAISQDSVSSSHYGYECLSCHNTGWDISTDNFGADEFVFFNPNQTPDYTITDQENWNKVKNVGCESCHDPMGTQDGTLNLTTHWAFGINNVPDFTADACGKCHNVEHHPYLGEWQQSLHASGAPDFIKNNREARGECFYCHFAQDFVAFLDDPNYDAASFKPSGELQNITCVTCHDPHSAGNSGQLRIPTGDAKTICDVCHTVQTEEVNVDETPHHTTSEALSGAVNFGYQYPGEIYVNSPHTYATRERCLDCHVHSSPFDATTGIAVTGHTFEPRTESCAQSHCHPNYYSLVDTTLTGKKFDYKRSQTVTDSLINVLNSLLASANSSNSSTNAFKQARYNLESVQQEGSRGIHNTRLVQKLLKDAISRFLSTSILPEDGLPVDYVLSQNYPNPFNPSTEIKFALPEAGIVTLIIYDALGKEITTLVNDYLSEGNYKARWNADGYSSGIYFYRIEVGNSFSMVKKLVFIK